MSSSESKISRRSFLSKVAWMVPAVSLPGCKPASDAFTGTQKDTDASLEYSPKYLSKDEWNFVMAACDRFIPADEDGPGAVAAGVPEFVDRQMNTPYAQGALWYLQGPFRQANPEFGYQMKLTPREILRLGVENVNAMCQTEHKMAFNELPHETQESVLSGLEKGEISLPDIAAKTFFSFLLQITREGFFSDPIHGGNREMVGWKLIGFPGARADFMDFVNQGGAPYPLPPVSIAIADPKNA